MEETRLALHTRLFVRDIDYYEDRAHGLIAVLPDGISDVIAQVRNWHPSYVAALNEDIRSAPLTIDDARLIYARQHGFESWTELAAYLERLADEPDDEPFLSVFEAGRSNNWARATSLLREHPDLVRARGTNGNTLINLAASLTSCADPHQPDPPPPRDGGTPLAVALFWGNREAADVMARSGVVPHNLRIAAGMGREDLVRQCFSPDGALTVGARNGRSFYRPHSGFPQWRPSDVHQEILDEALVWAAKSDRPSVMPLLVERGTQPNADPYRGTPLIWAATTGRLNAARWLLDNGAEINLRATFGGPSHGSGVTALHLAAQANWVAMVQLLLARGADPAIEDALYHSPALGWARHGGAKGAVEVLEKGVSSK